MPVVNVGLFMVPKRRGRNPFYGLLVVVGVVFVVTAFAYSLVTYAAIQGHLASSPSLAEHPLCRFLDRHGGTLLQVELGLVGLMTCAAIGTDRFWADRNAC